jgi:ubiquinone/menaquinone biosynthesis C-methylase UbiE
MRARTPSSLARLLCWRIALVEFTGERVIPGQVDVDLWNEHIARYTFAARFVRGKRVLDAGCGAGYGSAELARSALTVVGADCAPEAVDFARERYRLRNLAFEQASCAALPHPDSSFDLVVAFEVIEHLEHWREFLLETRRVLAPAGQFIVSTPNKLYYTESRGATGANPFHAHEFTFEEFCSELQAVFPHVAMFLENHVEGVAFQPHQASDSVELRADSSEPAPDNSHFFVAVCANQPQGGHPAYVYLPSAGNVLRERERHIALLEREIETKNGWLEKAQEDLAEFARKHQALAQELERSNQWAAALNREVAEKGARVTELQEELAREQASARDMADGYEAKVRHLEGEVRERTQWAIDTETRLTADLHREMKQVALAVEALHHTEKELEERTAWARQLREELEKLQAQLAMYRASRWVKLGRKAGLGPPLPTD